jgi:hypothetical protein
MRTILLIYLAFISNQIMAQKERVEIDTIKTDKNRYRVRMDLHSYNIRDINYYYKRKGIRIEPNFYSYSIKNLSNKIDVWGLQKKYSPKGYPLFYFNPDYNPSRASRFLLDSLIRLNVGEEPLKKSFFDSNDTTGYINFSVIYDLAGKVAEVTLIDFTTSQPAKFDIKDVEKMEEIIKTYADFVPNITSDKSKTAMEVYPLINFFQGRYYFYLQRLNRNVRSNHSRSIEVPKFNIQPKAN